MSPICFSTACAMQYESSSIFPLKPHRAFKTLPSACLTASAESAMPVALFKKIRRRAATHTMSKKTANRKRTEMGWRDDSPYARYSRYWIHPCLCNNQRGEQTARTSRIHAWLTSEYVNSPSEQMKDTAAASAMA